MPPDPRRAIARVLAPGSQGTGFAVARDLVATSLHVVADRKKSPVVPYGAIEVRFRGQDTLSARLIDWDVRCDWALLRCAVPDDVEPLVLRPATPGGALDRPWWTFGYPDLNNVDGSTVRGELRNLAATYGGAPALELQSEDLKDTPVHGHSGSPCFEGNDQEVDTHVIGVIRAALEEDERCFGKVYATGASAVLSSAHLATQRAVADRLVRGDTGGSPAAQGPYLVPARADVPFCGRAAQLEQLTALLEADDPRPIVAFGDAGVGKSRLAIECARRYYQAHGGTVAFIRFTVDPVTDLHALGKATGVIGAPIGGESLHDLALRVLALAPPTPTLLLYDDVPDPDVLAAWLPSHPAFRVLATSTHGLWLSEYRTIEIPRLSDADARTIVDAIVRDPVVAAREARALCERAGGIAMQLVPDARETEVARRRKEPPSPAPLASNASSSFERPWLRLDEQARVFLGCLALYRATDVDTTLLHGLLRAAGWDDARIRAAQHAAIDKRLVELDAPRLHLHGLVRTFVRTRDAVPPDLRAHHARRFVELARAVVENPAEVVQRNHFLAHDVELGAWPTLDALGDGGTVGQSLEMLGRYAEAQPYFERAVAEAEKGVAAGQIDPSSLGIGLHLVGACLSRRGRYEEAEPYFERAVAEAQKGDRDGRVDAESVGSSLHEVGVCLARRGLLAEAQPYFERAVAAKELGDLDGKVDPDSLGRSLHEVGFCLSSRGLYEEAQPYFERAVTASEQGDVRGQVDPESVGSSLHQVGVCLSHRGLLAEAQPYFERAVKAAEQGDLYGRVDPESLGKSLHMVGSCLANRGQHAEALPYFERAAEAKERGDLHGRIDPESIGKSLHRVGDSLARRGMDAEALPYFERAVKAKEQGNVHGRVAPDSVEISRRALAECRARLGE